MPRCSRCAAEVPENWVACPSCAAPLSDAAETAVMEPSSSTSSVPEEGRFPAGTVLAGRYRILGLLGSGGMGQVYRAHDQVLNQSVALKFLSEATRTNEAALARFRNEVRVARQVSHPNVCRVYDIGVLEGLHFLSMEYVDGEDLASLLRRIGRLPQDKALEFTRRICGGLAAAHERGVLHRDLKPANIMIDGRGQVRITDFGLAVLATEVAHTDVRSGTPAYMSPEQRAGNEVTRRSDLYSLGLVLYEMFTGKRRSDRKSNPTDLVKDLDPAIEQIILRCLEEDPRNRPSSALAVAMALPGGDPIAAALAAGETPSPEMVAASRGKDGFSHRAARTCFAAIIGALAVVALLNEKVTLLGHAPLELSPEVLAFRAQETLRKFGYTEKPKTVASGFTIPDTSYLEYLIQRDPAHRDERLASHQPPVILFWYRQHREDFNPFLLITRFNRFVFANTAVTESNPANTMPGMIRFNLDAKGRLTALEVRPWEWGGTDAPHGHPDGANLFAAAGLDPVRFVSAPPQRIPPMAFDARLAWTGSYDATRPERLRVEAAWWRDRPVFFDITGGSQSQTNTPTGRYGDVSNTIGTLIFAAVITGTAVIARQCVKQGRSDRRGATRVAIVIFLLTIGQWALVTGHVPGLWEFYLLLVGLSWASFVAGFLGLLYLAIEPYIRRHWPDALISWSRLLAGRIRDPLVGSHVLAGLVLAASFRAANAVMWIGGDRLFGNWQVLVPLNGYTSLDSLPSFGGHLSWLFAVNAVVAAGFVLLVALARRVVRRAWLADLVVVLLVSAPPQSASLAPVQYAASILFALAIAYSGLWLLRRFGLLALYVSLVTAQMLQVFPVAVRSWYAGRSFLLLLLVAGTAAWALSAATAPARRGADSRA